MAAEPQQQPAGAAPPGDPVNQGAPGGRPVGESPASVGSDKDAFDERPEAFVGGAFAGGFLLALIVRWAGK